MFTQILQLQNILTKDNIFVYPSTYSVDSSYGLECWIDKDNNSYGQVQFNIPFGFIKKNLFIPVFLYIRHIGKEDEKIIIYADSNRVLIDSHLEIYGDLNEGLNDQFEIIGAVYQDDDEKQYHCFGTDMKTIVEYLDLEINYNEVIESEKEIENEI